MKNLTMDFYELTMGQGYYNEGKDNDEAYFDVFFRKVPDKGSFAIANGINDIVDFLKNWTLDKSDVDYLRTTNKFSDNYLKRLQGIRFTGDMWAVKDGTVVFPNEPIITIKAKLLEAQLVETAILTYFNRASLITTKASRIVRAAQGRGVMEFGTRRAQGETSAIDGARDAYIAGAIGTACTEAGKKYGIPVLGTMAHSFVQSFDSEYESFVAYAKTYPDDCSLLVDTYDTLKSGIPNAIRVNEEILKPMGKKLKGIRIDSGDLSYLAKRTRTMLDNAGLNDTKIILSNSLDEYTISSLLEQQAPVDSFGVGENLINAKSDPVFGGVYKLVAMVKNKTIIPKIKISDNVEKITNPGFKKIFRFYDQDRMLITDEIYMHDEEKPTGAHTLIDPAFPFNTKTITNYQIRELGEKMIERGSVVAIQPTIEETRNYLQEELSTLWPEAKRDSNPQTYIVNLSKKLGETKTSLLMENKEKPERSM